MPPVEMPSTFEEFVLRPDNFNCNQPCQDGGCTAFPRIQHRTGQPIGLRNYYRLGFCICLPKGLKW